MRIRAPMTTGQYTVKPRTQEWKNVIMNMPRIGPKKIEGPPKMAAMTGSPDLTQVR